MRDINHLKFVPFWLADFQRDTRRMSPEEKGIFISLWVEYMEEGHLPDNDEILARIAGVNLDDWVETYRSAMMGFFHISKGQWFQPTWDNNRRSAIERAKNARNKATTAARARWNDPSKDAYREQVEDTDEEEIPF
jgi:uncharacterized protein YdaU (DUF1376 family)